MKGLDDNLDNTNYKFVINELGGLKYGPGHIRYIPGKNILQND